MVARDSVADVATTELVIERVFDAPRERVWEVFTRPEHIQKWWGPKHFSAPVTEIDLRAGGAFRFAMRGPDGKDYWNAGTVRDVTPPSRLVLAMYFANEKGERVSPTTYGFPEGSPDEQITTFTFEAQGARTKLTLRQGPIPAGMGENAKLGWTTSLEKAADAIAALTSGSTDDVVVERVFDAPRERVFEVFTRPEHLQKWWGPAMTAIPLAEFEARPGGKLFFAERAPSGAMNYISGVVREIERPSLLTFAIHFANEKRERVAPPVHAGLPATWDGEIVTTVEFISEGQRTRLRITAHRSSVTTEFIEKVRAGWGQSLDRLGHAVVDDMKVVPTGDRDIVITRTFNAPRALVYAAMTNAEHIKKWWGPGQYGSRTAEADFRPGGRYRFAQGSPQGEVAFRGEVRESSLDRIVYTEEFEMMPGHIAVTTATLEERGGKTVLTVRTTFPSAADRDGMIQSGMEWGARLSYLQLDEVLDSLKGKAA